MRKPGCLEPVIYFVNGGGDREHPIGFVLLAPYSEFPAPHGYRTEAAETLAEVDKLQKRLQDQELLALEREAIHDNALIAPRLAEVRDRLYARATSKCTSEYERDFIREWLKMRADHPRKKFYEESFNCYLWARENNIPKGRGAGEEVFNNERHEVRD